jgi:hypothetical protein
MLRHRLRDDQWGQIKNLLPGRVGCVGVPISTVPALKKDGEDQAIGR